MVGASVSGMRSADEVSGEEDGGIRMDKLVGPRRLLWCRRQERTRVLS